MLQALQAMQTAMQALQAVLASVQAMEAMEAMQAMQAMQAKQTNECVILAMSNHEVVRFQQHKGFIRGVVFRFLDQSCGHGIEESATARFVGPLDCWRYSQEQSWLALSGCIALQAMRKLQAVSNAYLGITFLSVQ